MIEPLVLEVAVDEAIDIGSGGPALRHAAWFLRTRPDLDPGEVEAHVP